MDPQFPKLTSVRKITSKACHAARELQDFYHLYPPHFLAAGGPPYYQKT